MKSLGIVFLLVIALAIMAIVLKIKYKVTLKNLLIYVCMGSLIYMGINTLYGNKLTFSKTNEAVCLSVQATREYNPTAEGNEIFIKSINVDGVSYNPEDCVVSGKWVNINDNLGWNSYTSGITDEIELEIPMGKLRVIVFEMNQYRGMVQIGNEGKIVDCYNNEDSYYTYHVDAGQSNLTLSKVIILLYTLFALNVLYLLSDFWSNIYGHLQKTFRVLFIQSDKGYYGIISFLVIIITITNTDSPLSNVLPWTDSDVFLYIGKALHEGKVLYSDVFDHKGPFLYVIEYLGMAIGIHGVWLLETVSLISTYVYIYMISKLFFDKNKALIITLLCFYPLPQYLCMGNYTEEYALPLVLGGMYLLIIYLLGKMRNYLCDFMIVGLCFTMAFLLRPNVVGMWPSFCLIILIKCIVYKEFRQLGNMIIGFIMGIILGILPFAVYFTYNDAWSDFIYAYFKFNFMYSESGISGLTVLSYFANNIIYILSCIALLLSITWSKLLKKEEILICCAGGIYFIIANYATIMSGATWDHYAMMLLPAYVIPLIILCSLISKKMKNIKRPYVLKSCYTAFMVMFLILEVNFIKQVYSLRYTLTGTTENVSDIVQIIKETTKSTDKMIVYGNAVIYYLEADRQPSSKYIYQLPIANIDNTIAEEFVADIQKNRPKIIVIPNIDILEYQDSGSTYINEYFKSILSQYTIMYQTESTVLFIDNNN